MSHEVYVCYSDEDKITADAICHVLEENKFKCWIKSRDAGTEHIADAIPKAISDSKILVLVFSKHAKKSNYVNTEIDMAFSNNIPIVVFKIDDSKLDGALEFFLENKHWLDAYPNPSIEFRNLVISVAKLLDKPISDPVIDSNRPDSSNVAEPPKMEAVSKDNSKDRKIIKLLLGMIVIPVILFIIGAGVMEMGSEMLGVGIVLIAFLFFVVTPIYYIIQWITSRE